MYGEVHKMSTHISDNNGEVDEGQKKVEKGL
jgi:hypothetical protein